MRKKSHPTAQHEQVGARVSELLKARRIPQKSMAEELQVSEGHVSRLLSGARPWTLQLVIAAAEFLGTDTTAIDPALPADLLEGLRAVSLPVSAAHARVAYELLRALPVITDPVDLEALAVLIRVFGERATLRAACS